MDRVEMLPAHGLHRRPGDARVEAQQERRHVQRSVFERRSRRRRQKALSGKCGRFLPYERPRVEGERRRDDLGNLESRVSVQVPDGDELRVSIGDFRHAVAQVSHESLHEADQRYGRRFRQRL